MPSRIAVLIAVSVWMPAALAANSGIQAILNDQHTMFFIGVNVLLTYYFAVQKFDRFAVVHGPEILTTVGIFGCFYGIALALLNFDATKVSASVPQLLEGVKTAFWASVSGVGGSLVIRARHKFQKTPIPHADGAPKAASLDDVVAATHALQKGLSGNEEGSLLSQLKLMRQEQSDQLTSLRTSFDTFANKMAEDGSKALIEALKTVIADFNAQINEQFGDNFKQLNLAVEKLVLWQQQYKEELDRLQGMQKSSADELRTATSGLALMVDRAEVFSKTAADLENLLRGLSQQYTLIEQSQRSLSTVLIEMREVTPQFSKKLDELSDSIKTGVVKVQSDVSEVVRNFGVQAQSSSAEMKQLLAETMKKTQSDVNDQMLKGLDVVRQGVVALDKGLQEELTKSLESLGGGVKTFV